MEMRERIKQTIKDYILARGYPPTVRDIALTVGLKSTSSVHHYIKTLIESGELETDEDSSSFRALRVPGMRGIDTQGREREMKQLKDLYLHCQEMAEEPDSADAWQQDIGALRWILEELDGKEM